MSLAQSRSSQRSGTALQQEKLPVTVRDRWIALFGFSVVMNSSARIGGLLPSGGHPLPRELPRMLPFFNFPEPGCFLEVPVVKRPFQPLLAKDRFRDDLKLNEGTCQEHSGSSDQAAVINTPESKNVRIIRRSEGSGPAIRYLALEFPAGEHLSLNSRRTLAVLAPRIGCMWQRRIGRGASGFVPSNRRLEPATLLA
jgi:hypothetical protein